MVPRAENPNDIKMYRRGRTPVAHHTFKEIQKNYPSVVVTPTSFGTGEDSGVIAPIMIQIPHRTSTVAIVLFGGTCTITPNPIPMTIAC